MERIKIKISNNYERRILEVLSQNSHGSTITDIANEMEASRNTISKYISRLEKMQHIESKKVGVYKLYYLYGDGIMSKNAFINFYKGLIYGLKIEFPNQEAKIKEIGKKIADFYKLPLTNKEKIEDKKTSIQTIMLLLEEFNSYNNLFSDNFALSSIQVLEPNIKFSIKLSNFSFLKDNDVFFYHGYILIGYMERLFMKKLGIPVNFNIKDFHISDNKAEESYVELILEF